MATAAGRRGATEQRVPGTKHDICVLWGNEGSVWAQPRAPGILFHAAFVPSPVPALPDGLLGTRRGQCQAGVRAAMPAGPCAPATGPQPCRDGRAWGAGRHHWTPHTIPSPAHPCRQGKERGRGDKMNRLKILKTKQNPPCPDRQRFFSTRVPGTSLRCRQRFCRVAACLPADSVAPSGQGSRAVPGLVTAVAGSVSATTLGCCRMGLPAPGMGRVNRARLVGTRASKCLA